jgi:hypothetical protein
VTRIPTAGEDKKFTVFGALAYASGRVIWQVSARKGEQAFLAFLDHLAATFPADVPTVIVLDNFGYHNSHALRERWQALSARFFPFWLPAYAPAQPNRARLAFPQGETQQPPLVERFRSPARSRRDAPRPDRGALPHRRPTSFPPTPRLLLFRLEPDPNVRCGSTICSATRTDSTAIVRLRAHHRRGLR